MQPSSTSHLNPSMAFFADPWGNPFSAWITKSTGRLSTPVAIASSNARR
jgi:hypothetical protein